MKVLEMGLARGRNRRKEVGLAPLFQFDRQERGLLVLGARQWKRRLRCASEALD